MGSVRLAFHQPRPALRRQQGRRQRDHLVNAGRLTAVIGVIAMCPVLLACSGAGHGSAWRASTGLPCPKLPSPDSSGGQPANGEPVVTSLADIAVSARLSSLRIWGHYLAYVADRRSVVVCDLDTGRVLEAASVEGESQAVLDYVVGAGDVVVYSRLSHVPNVTGRDAFAEWTIESFDLRTGHRRVVARSGAEGSVDTRYEFLPTPAAEWPWVTWTKATEADDDGQSGSGAVHTLDLRSGQERVVAPGSRRPGRVGVSRGTVVFDGTVEGEPDPARRDLYAVPADGSAPPRRLTTQGRVRSPIVRDGLIAWRTRATAEA